MKIIDSLSEALQTLREFMSCDYNIKNIENAGKVMLESIEDGGKIIACGNGGSMCDAMHFAEELTGNFRKKRKAIPAISISDPSHITCTANDYGFDYIFSRYIEAFGKKNDVLLAISTSGNSPNIIKAAEKAKEKGVKIIALSGKDGGKLKDIADIEIRAPFSQYSDRIQEIHIKVIHILIDYIESNIDFNKLNS